jgi:hypothetical protein
MSILPIMVMVALGLAAEFLSGGWSFAAYIFAVSSGIVILRAQRKREPVARSCHPKTPTGEA